MTFPFNIEINLLLTLFYLLTIRKFMQAFFHSKPILSINYFLWILYYVFQIFIIIEEIFSPGFVLALNISFVLFLTFISCHGSLKKYFIFAISICTVWMLVEIIVVIVLAVLGLNDAALQNAGSATSKMIMFVLAVFSEHYIKQKGSWEIPFYLFLIMLMIPIGSIYIIHNIFLIAYQYNSYSFFAIITGILLLLINYVIFEIYKWIRQNVEMKEKNLLYEQQLELHRQQAEEREVKNLEIRKLRHDITNHMACLLGMVQENENEKASSYIEEMLKNNVNYQTKEVSRSGNIVIDSLVNYKCASARKAGITFQTNIFIPSSLPFQSSHLTIILGNLLENALDACHELKEEKCYIKLIIFWEKDILTITVCNPYRGKRHRNQDGSFLTTKSNARNHGLGLSLVKQAAESYYGEMFVKYENGVFQNTVIIYANTENK